jgi:hypothetical protein
MNESQIASSTNAEDFKLVYNNFIVTLINKLNSLIVKTDSSYFYRDNYDAMVSYKKENTWYYLFHCKIIDNKKIGFSNDNFMRDNFYVSTIYEFNLEDLLLNLRLFSEYALKQLVYTYNNIYSFYSPLMTGVSTKSTISNTKRYRDIQEIANDLYTHLTSTLYDPSFLNISLQELIVKIGWKNCSFLSLRMHKSNDIYIEVFAKDTILINNLSFSEILDELYEILNYYINFRSNTSKKIDFYEVVYNLHSNL